MSDEPGAEDAGNGTGEPQAESDPQSEIASIISSYLAV